MEAQHENLVVGLFESQRQADAALEGLHRLGIADADVEIGEPEPGRYRIEYHESAEFWTAVRRGMIVGAAVGIVVSVGIIWLAVPGLTLLRLLELGVPMGAAWGLFVGGLSGAAAKSAMLFEVGEPRYAVTPESHDVLMIVHAGGRFGMVHEALQRRHPRYFLADVPAVHHAGPHLAATA